MQLLHVDLPQRRAEQMRLAETNRTHDCLPCNEIDSCALDYFRELLQLQLQLFDLVVLRAQQLLVFDGILARLLGERALDQFPVVILLEQSERLRERRRRRPAHAYGLVLLEHFELALEPLDSIVQVNDVALRRLLLLVVEVLVLRATRTMSKARFGYAINSAEQSAGSERRKKRPHRSRVCRVPRLINNRHSTKTHFDRVNQRSLQCR